MNGMKVEVTVLVDMLGMTAADKDIHLKHIASRSADAEKMAEEDAALPANTLMEKAMTVFPRDTDGMPIFWDYQLKGFFKEGFKILAELQDGEVKIGKSKLSKFTAARLVDNYLFCGPRRIRLAPVSGTCTRPLRGWTMQGERVSLATSEVVPAGTTFVFEVKWLLPELEKLVRMCLDYGALKGLGQWRNAGMGRFEWREVK